MTEEHFYESDMTLQVLVKSYCPRFLSLISRASHKRANILIFGWLLIDNEGIVFHVKKK